MRRFVPLIFPLVIFVLSVFFLFKPFFIDSKLPIPSDTIVGLYHPFRDLYANEFPRGVPYKNFLITDPVRQQYPWRLLAIEQEKKWQLPLWNPYSLSGTPLLGSLQAAAFYPFNVLLFILPFSIGWSLLIVLQMVLAGIFLYFYLRNLGLYRLSSFFGGLIFAFCGFSVAWLEWGTILHVGLWLPLILLSIDKLESGIRNQDVSKQNLFLWFFLLLFAICSSFFAGHLQTFFYIFLICLLYLVARWIQFGFSKKSIVVFLLLAVCFLIVTAVQWYPTFQLIAESARSVDQVNWQRVEGWFVPWQHLIQFVAPDFFGNPTTLNYWGTWNYGELVGYVGMVPLVMALSALFFRRDRKTLFFGTIFFLSLIFVLPTIFGKLPYLLQFPFLSTSQPTRLLFLTDFTLSILAAFGIDWYIRQNKKNYVIFPLLFVGGVLVGLWLFVLQGSGENILVAKRNLYFPTLLFFLTFLVIGTNILIKNKKVFFILIGILLLISVVDLLRFAQKFTPFTGSEYLFPQTRVLSFLQKDKSQFRIMATDSRIMPPNFAVMYHLQSVDGYDPLYLRRYGELIAASERGKPDIHPPFGFNRIITPENIDSSIIDLLGVKYVLSFSKLSEPKFSKVFEEGQTKVYKNNNTFPRAFLVANVKVVKDKQEAIRALFDKTIDLHNTAVVYSEVGYSSFAQGDVRISDYSGNKVVVEVKNPSIGFLVLTDSYYPSWKVKICSPEGLDCKKEKIILTNYNFRGVVVPAGNHRIIFYNSLL